MLILLLCRSFEYSHNNVKLIDFKHDACIYTAHTCSHKKNLIFFYIYWVYELRLIFAFVGWRKKRCKRKETLKWVWRMSKPNKVKIWISWLDKPHCLIQPVVLYFFLFYFFTSSRSIIIERNCVRFFKFYSDRKRTL